MWLATLTLFPSLPGTSIVTEGFALGRLSEPV